MVYVWWLALQLAGALCNGPATCHSQGSCGKATVAQKLWQSVVKGAATLCHIPQIPLRHPPPAIWPWQTSRTLVPLVFLTHQPQQNSKTNDQFWRALEEEKQSVFASLEYGKGVIHIAKRKSLLLTQTAPSWNKYGE